MSFLTISIIETAADQALDGKKRVVGIGDGLALGGLADQPLALGRERDHRGGRARTLGVFDNLRAGAIHDRDTGVRGAEIDTDNLGHKPASFWRLGTTGPRSAPLIHPTTDLHSCQDGRVTEL